MKIGFATPDMSDIMGHSSQHYFEEEIKRQLGPCEGEPDWLFAWYMSTAFPKYAFKMPSVKIPSNRSYKVMGRISDLHHGRPAKCVKWLNSIELDLLLFPYRSVASHERNYYWENVKAEKAFLPWSYEPSLYYLSEKHEYDITFLGRVHATAYPLRTNISRRLPSLCKEMGWKLFTRVKPPHLSSIKKWDPHPTYVAGKSYARALRSGKVTIFGSSKWRYPIKKWFQSLGSGTCVLADAPLNSDRLGLEDGENYIEINKENWVEKLKWILSNEGERRRIAKNGLNLARERHTHEVRVKELLKILGAFS